MQVHGAFVLAYDTHCGPCSKFRTVVGLLDARRRIRFVSLEAADGSGVLEGIEASARYSSFHLLARGRVWSGPKAMVPLAILLSPSGRAARLFMSVPAAGRLLSLLYSSLSRLHGACPLRSRASVATWR